MTLHELKSDLEALPARFMAWLIQTIKDLVQVVCYMVVGALTIWLMVSVIQWERSCTIQDCTSPVESVQATRPLTK